MEQKHERHENHYKDLDSYMKEIHEKNKKRIKTSGIVLLLLPIVLGLIRFMTDSDKTVFLIIWVFCMFILAAYLVSVDYLDNVIYKKLKDMTDGREELDGLLDSGAIIPPAVRDRIKDRLDPDPDDGSEEGGGR